MKDDHKKAAQLLDQNPGGGSGGDMGSDDAGNQLKSAEATYQIGGNQVILISRPAIHLEPVENPPKTPSSKIVLIAAGALPEDLTQGTVDIRGAKGVRITSGAPALPMMSPPVSSKHTNGAEIAVQMDQNIMLDRGDPKVPTSQSIHMTPGAIYVNGQDGEVMITSLKSITLAVGQNSITIDTTGITIIGLPAVQINPMGPPEMPPLADDEGFA